MLGHILRMCTKHAMIRWFDRGQDAFRGRPRTSIASVISDDLRWLAEQADRSLNTSARLASLKDHHKLEQLASYRQRLTPLSRIYASFEATRAKAEQARRRNVSNNNNMLNSTLKI